MCVCVCVRACVVLCFAIARHQNSAILLVSSTRVCECVQVCVFVCVYEKGSRDVPLLIMILSATESKRFRGALENV